MPWKKANSSSSSSSSSQLSSPRVFVNGSFEATVKSPLCDAEKVNYSSDLSTPTPDKELRDEILELETEIFHLERYLLSLYRTSFGDHLSALLPPDESSLCLKTPPSMSNTALFHNERVSSVFDTPSFESLHKMNKIKRAESGHPSLADLLGLNTLTPNNLSEDIVRLICEVFIKLSHKGQSRIVKNSKNEVINRECGQELGVVISNLCLDDSSLKTVESMLQNFRSLVLKLEKVDPATMTREEKLAFWINIHNALVMHGYIINGVCEDRPSRMIKKAAFNIGGDWVSAYDVQSSILRIRDYHLSSRLRTLFSPARRSKTSSSGHTYALEFTEPLLHFALSTGSSTDPMVRVYTAGGIFQELRQARDDFIRTSVLFENEASILLPKIIHNYAKDSSLYMADLFNIISECLGETERNTMIRILKKKRDRCISWINHDSNFCYIIDWVHVNGSP